PYQDEDSDYAAVIPIFSRALLTGEAPVIYGDGKQTRDFTFVGNVVQANLLAAEREQAVGKIMNVACGGSYDLNYLLEKLQRAYDTNIKAVYEDPRTGDVKHSKADISLAREALGYEPATGFEEGLKETAEWYLRKISTAQSNPNS
ncbi:MAG: NAD-dependent epimerase/dehydratase family protein, partial [Gemmatimonadetes bacterium]|nr:NAD-dependent epimerase/dehydratase family protein [Gemmatimonadota bacterium]